jgi:mannose-6-phosphate isomerase-like protein (cupin superfamily)
MRIAINALGTRGDVQPYVALGLGLERAGHEVRLVTHTIFRELAKQHGLTFYPLDLDPREVLLNESLSQFGSNPIRVNQWIEHRFAPVLGSVFEATFQAAQDAELMVNSGLSIAGWHVAEKLGIPAVAAYLWPATPTRTMPAAEDRQVMDRTPGDAAAVAEWGKRVLQREWGCRVPLAEARYQNCWLFGVGQAHFRSDVMCLAYLDFPSAESLGADDHRHRLHLHRESWEFYVVLQGTRVLRIEQELAEVSAGEVLAVPPRVKHVLHGTETPFVGFTFRTPLLNDKVEF